MICNCTTITDFNCVVFYYHSCDKIDTVKSIQTALIKKAQKVLYCEY